MKKIVKIIGNLLSFIGVVAIITFAVLWRESYDLLKEYLAYKEFDQKIVNTAYLECDHEIMKLEKEIPTINNTKTYFFFNEELEYFFILYANEPYMEYSMRANDERNNEIIIEDNYAEIIREDLSIKYNRKNQDINILYHKVYDSWDLTQLFYLVDFKKEDLKTFVFSPKQKVKGKCKTILFEDLSKDAKRIPFDILSGVAEKNSDMFLGLRKHYSD